MKWDKIYADYKTMADAPSREVRKGTAISERGSGVRTFLDVLYFEGFRAVIQSLGFQMIVTDEGESRPISQNVWEYLEKFQLNLQDGSGIEDYFKKRVFKVAVQCDYADADPTSFLKKLSRIGDNLQQQLISNGLGAAWITKGPKSETDVSLLKIMKQVGPPIDSALKPLIYWGDENLINTYLRATILEENYSQLLNRMEPWRAVQEAGRDAVAADYDSEEIINAEIKRYIHPLDEMLGLNLTYMKSVRDIFISPAWTGPFGPNNSGDVNAITYDTNKNRDTFKEINKNQPFKGSRMPVFTFGEKNSNILEIDFNLTPIYFAGIMNSRPIPIPGNQATTNAVTIPGAKTVQDLANEDMKILLGIAGMENYIRFPPMEANQKTGKMDIRVPSEFRSFILKNDQYTKKGYVGARLGAAPPMGTNLTAKQAKAVEMEYQRKKKQLNADIRTLWINFILLYNKMYRVPMSKRKFTTNTHIDKQFVSNSAVMLKEIMRSTIKGRITTVPLFHLSTKRRTLWRPCELRCREPAIYSGYKEINLEDEELRQGYYLWMSGQYEMVGYKHTITSTTAYSEFHLQKGSDYGSDTEEYELDEEGKLQTNSSIK